MSCRHSRNASFARHSEIRPEGRAVAAVDAHVTTRCAASDMGVVVRFRLAGSAIGQSLHCNNRASGDYDNGDTTPAYFGRMSPAWARVANAFK